MIRFFARDLAAGLGFGFNFLFVFMNADQRCANAVQYNLDFTQTQNGT